MILVATKPKTAPEPSDVSLTSLTYIRNGGTVQATAVIEIDGETRTYHGFGASVESVLVEQLQELAPGIVVISHQAKKMGKGDAEWKVTMAVRLGDRVVKSCNFDEDVNTATARAIISALNEHRNLRHSLR